MRLQDLAAERRKKARFPMQRELRYRLLDGETIVETGMGRTVDVCSGGVAFQIGHELTPGLFIELSISWPVLLEDACPMRLIAFGRVLRSTMYQSVCTMDKYEFRTQARAQRPAATVRTDSMLQRWADYIRKENVKIASA
jgi:hypothetical protein